jgi:hypothetical protein
MKSFLALSALLIALPIMATGQTPAQKAAAQKPISSLPPISKQTHLEIIHTFLDDLVYIRTPFPMGKTGLTLKDGNLSPNGQNLQKLLAMWGPSVKPGDLGRITAIDIKHDRIHLVLNGGPIKKKKWYQHVEVGMDGGTAPIAPSDAGANPRGTFVDLVFDHYVPDLNAEQLKELLRPVFDFNSRSAEEAYLDTVPPKVKEAIQNHQVLVGMDRQMVIYAKGRPPKKDREKQGEAEYEEWIYGQPPQDVEFVRFVGDEVVRVETMKVDGQKIVRTQKEIELTPKPAVAAESRPANAPSLRRPGEEVPTDSPDAPRSDSPSAMPPPPPPSPAPTGAPPNNLIG